MNLIVAVDKNWGIGYKGELLVSLPSDMKHFVDMTKGKTVIMGRKTLASFPGGTPLKNRQNIVFSTSLKRKEDVIIVNGLDEFKSKIKDIDLEKCFVIGGEKIYRLLLPYCTFAYITKIDKSFIADTFFPDLDEIDNWSVKQELKTIFENGIYAKILLYKNNDVKKL